MSLDYTFYALCLDRQASGSTDDDRTMKNVSIDMAFRKQIKIDNTLQIEDSYPKVHIIVLPLLL